MSFMNTMAWASALSTLTCPLRQTSDLHELNINPQPERDALLEFSAGFGYTRCRRYMMSIRQLLQSKRTHILQIAARHGAQEV